MTLKIFNSKHHAINSEFQNDFISKINIKIKTKLRLKYGFCKKLLLYNDLEKKWGQKGSTGESFNFTEVTSKTSYKIHILETNNIGQG